MRIHIVQKGDTLWKIAKKYGVNFEELKSINTQLSNPDMIMPGMKIKVPQGTKAVKKEMPKKAKAPAKEMPKKPKAPVKEMPSAPPYKDTSPKPIPVIKEDEKKPAPKGMMEKPMMPMQPIHMNMQMPSIDQQMQNYYTTFHLPQMPPMPEKPQEKMMPAEEKMHKEEESPMSAPQQYAPGQPMMPQQYAPQGQPMMPQQYAPQGPPMQPQLMHTDYYCCPPHPVMMPMQHHPMFMQPAQHMPPGCGSMTGGAGYQDEPSSNMPAVQGASDCGCGGTGQQPYGPMMGYGGHTPMYHHPMAYGPGYHPWHQQGGDPQGGWSMPQSYGNPQQQGQPWEQDPWRDDEIDES